MLTNHKVHLYFFFFLIWLLGPSKALAFTNTYYISPTGSDSNPGTLEQPFQTIAHTKDFLRTAKTGISGNITVYLRQGTYVQNQTLFFGQQDSGNPNQTITYASYNNEDVLISGGQKYSNWQTDGSRWKTYIGPNQNFRNLWVNGNRATRAKSGSVNSPVFGTDYQWVSTTRNVGGENKEVVLGIQSNNPIVSQMSSWPDLNQAEIVHRWEWLQYICKIDQASDNLIHYVASNISGPCQDVSLSIPGITARGHATPLWIENALELLDEPGEWYYQKDTGWLFYLPKSNENIQTTYAVVPNLTNLIQLGNSNSPVSYLNFQGLNFAYNTWQELNLQPTGIAFDTQNRGAIYPTGLIYLANGSHIQISNGQIVHSGTDGITILNHAQNIEIFGNQISDISASGINASADSDNANVSYLDFHDNLLLDNTLEYWSGGGIACGGKLTNANFSHNRISRTSSNAIVCATHTGQAVSISYNHVDEYRKILVDNGGIYDVSAGGVAPKVSHNYVVGPNDSVASQGIYYDEGANDGEISNNVILEKTGIIMHRSCRNKVFGNFVKHLSNSQGGFIVQAGRIQEVGAEHADFGCDGSVNPTWGNGTNDIYDNQEVSDFTNPQVQSIIAEAGLNSDYKALYNQPLQSWPSLETIYSSLADFNNDRIIDLTDFLIWKQRYINLQSSINDFLKWKSSYLQ